MKKVALSLLICLVSPIFAWSQGMSPDNFIPLNNNKNEFYAREDLFHLRNAAIQKQLFDYERTFLELENAVAQNPYSAEALLRRAIFKTKVGLETEAAEDVRKANRINPYAANLYGYHGAMGVLDVMYSEPKEALAELDLDKKVSYYYDIIDQQSADNSLETEELNLIDIAITAIEEENLFSALNTLEYVTEQYPNSAVAYDLKGMILAHKKEYKKAITAVTRAIALQPKFATAWYNLGRINREMGNLDEAEQHFNHAISLQDNLTKARFDKALLLKKAGKKEAAIREYDEIIAMRGSDYLEAYLNRGLTRKMIGDFEGAIDDLNQVIDRDENNSEAYKNRANIYLLYGYHVQAIDDYTTAIELNPEYAEAYFNRGLAQFLIYNRYAGCYDMEQAAKYGFSRAIEKQKYFCVE